MTRTDKGALIASLADKIKNNEFFYVADSSQLSVAQVNSLRALCFEKEVEMKVVKNTLVEKAILQQENPAAYEGLLSALKGPTTLMFCKTANVPAKVIKKFREQADKPVLKAAYIDSAIFHGDNQIDALVSLKSKEELIGDIVLLLQSPAKNVVSALKSGGNTISGLLKALEQRG